MAMKVNSGDRKTRSSVSLFIVVGLCCFFYILGAWQKSGFGKGDKIAVDITKQTDCGVIPNLNFETHHSGQTGATVNGSEIEVKVFDPCPAKYVDYTPCQNNKRAMKLPRENMIYRERHCPTENDRLHCLVPAPKGYVTPFPWPKSRDYVPYANAPYKSLTVEKAIQNWIQYEGNVFKFPGGGTQFPQGADAYIDQLASVIPIENGTVRTALDTGCGVASWGAYLLKRNVIAMSFAPRDSHQAQVQFALERGVPAVIGVLGTIKLPYPSRAFDMAHCSRCLIPWGANDGIYMMEVDRVLRPGGYWVLSGPPINWKTNYLAWKLPKEELQEEQRKIEEIAEQLCWEKKHEDGEIAVWRKRLNTDSCPGRDEFQAKMCESTDADDVWYKKMEACITPYPEVKSPDELAGVELKVFPDRLNVVPPRIATGSIPGVSEETYMEDKKLWTKHANAYRKIITILDSGRYRNIMDMNAGLGSFAAAIESPKLWVMNVVPTISVKNTLGAIYERGLIGIYHDCTDGAPAVCVGGWAHVSVMPRNGNSDGAPAAMQSKAPAMCVKPSQRTQGHMILFMLMASSACTKTIALPDTFVVNKTRCNVEDILLEMDRILRPEGTVIFRDDVDVLIKVMKIVGGMRWNTKMIDHEDGPVVPEKVMVAVKQYWVIGENNSTSS
ncbi:hypothetical protein IFM89_001284 [Coptis chinensis]|uniref:Methyltransferase n=1 Tax=Coptis chinensis TaxID=261450 RepID=A0A835H114_9MAGN|nr:hypothetical protein IFM89_001284 [Coptis chinensis]